MTDIVQAACPRCKRVLRIPRKWLQSTVRCKHCGIVVKAIVGTASEPKEAKTESAAAAAPTAPADDFSFADLGAGLSPVTERYRRRNRSRGVRGTVWAIVAVALVAAVGAGVYANRERLFRPGSAAASSRRTEEKAVASVVPVVFPRRALAISVNNYLYANPIGYGSSGDEEAGQPPGRAGRTVHTVFQRLAEALHIPQDQRAELGDATPEGQAVAPTKNVIEANIDEFLDTSRPQDRILLLFVGHAVLVDDKPFLVPIEGELKVAKTLIPLSWVYERLARCKARQKVLVLDVCRLDPGRGLERPDGGAMETKLDLMLKNPPPGVQVWYACVAGQHSYEGYLDTPDGTPAHGGYFLSELFEAVGPDARRHVNLGDQQPDQPIPVQWLAEGRDRARGVDRSTQAEVEEVYKEKETPRLAGDEAAVSAPFDSGAPPPGKLTVKAPPPPPGGPASRALVAGILKEIGSIPPVKVPANGWRPITPESLPVFSAKVLEKYGDRGASSPLRAAVEKAVRTLREPRTSRAFEERFVGQKGNDAKIKEMILAKQREPAIALDELGDTLKELLEAGKSRDKEPSPRWRANYDYILARLEERIAYVYEYDYMLGQIRKDALPPRDPAVHIGWRLASREKLQSGSEASKKAADAKKILARLAEENPETPWEILAKREALTALGLEWKPTR